jgi:hypothetical protein
MQLRATAFDLPCTETVDFSTEFAPAGAELTIESIPVCPGETGRYAWHDACAPRAALFGGTWHRY